MPKIIFCKGCNNMTYPKLQAGEIYLKYFCLKCEREAEGIENCVYHHQISHVPTESKMMVPELGADYTLPRNSGELCPKCKAPEPVFFQSNSRHKETKMVLYFVCTRTKCSHRWTTKPVGKKKKDETIVEQAPEPAGAEEEEEEFNEEFNDGSKEEKSKLDTENEQNYNNKKVKREYVDQTISDYENETDRNVIDELSSKRTRANDPATNNEEVMYDSSIFEALNIDNEEKEKDPLNTSISIKKEDENDDSHFEDPEIKEENDTNLF